jgi:hypothetical protein
MFVSMWIHWIVFRMSGVDVVHFERVRVPVCPRSAFQWVSLGPFNIRIVESWGVMVQPRPSRDVSKDILALGRGLTPKYVTCVISQKATPLFLLFAMHYRFATVNRADRRKCFVFVRYWVSRLQWISNRRSQTLFLRHITVIILRKWRVIPDSHIAFGLRSFYIKCWVHLPGWPGILVVKFGRGSFNIVT